MLSSSKCALSFRDVVKSPNATLESRVSPSKRTRTVPRSSFLAFPSRFVDDDDDDDEVLRRQTVTLRRRRRPRRRRRRRRLRAGMSSAMMMIQRPPLVVSANDALGIWAVVLASAHFGAWAEKKPWGAALGGACLIAALTTLILANLGTRNASRRLLLPFF